MTKEMGICFGHLAWNYIARTAQITHTTFSGKLSRTGIAGVSVELIDETGETMAERWVVHIPRTHVSVS